MEHGYNVTGIPTDLLLMGIGTIIFAMLSWALHELLRLSKHTTTMRYVMKLVCKKLDIPYPNGD
jgi:hypothetical protein